MERTHAQLLTTLTTPERCSRYQMIRLTNLNDDHDCLIKIFEIRISYAIGFIYTSNVLIAALIGIGANERTNFLVVVSSCTILMLMDEISQFLVIYMNVHTVLMNMLKKHCNINELYMNIVYILLIASIFDDSIDYLVFVATMTTIAWKIIKIQISWWF